MANKFIIEIVTKGFADAHKDLGKLNTQSRSFVKNANRAGSATAKLRSSFSALRNNLLLITFAFGGLFIAINKTVAAYRKQVEAETRLRASLRNVITASEDGADKLINLAAALQKVTTFGDENIIAGMAMLSTFQLNEDAIAALTPRMLDMAAAMGKGGDGLTTIALQLGKAFTGQVGALSRSGVLIDNFGVQMARAKGPTEEFAFLIEELDKNFKGLARQLATTTLGQIDQMENRISDMNERMGQTLVPLKLFMKETEMFIMESLARWPLFFEKWKEFANLPMAERWKKSWAEAEAEFIKLEQAATFATGQTNKTLEARRKELTDQNALGMQREINDLLKDDGVISILDKIVLNKQKQTDLDVLHFEGLVKTADFETKSAALTNEGFQLAHQQKIKLLLEKQAIEKQGDISRALADDGVINSLEQINLLENERIALQTQLNEGVIEGNTHKAKDIGLQNQIIQLTMARKQAELEAGADLLNNLSRLSGSNKGFAIAAARLSQASAIIDTYAGANKAFAQGGVLGFLTGASVIAAGLANVKEIQTQIAEMSSAKHGADFVTSGPQMMMVGEGSGPEHVQVTPLSDSNINGPQGGGVTINISGGVVQDDYVRNTLIPAINKATGTGAKLNA